MKKKITVIVVDDSALIRALFSDLLGSDPDIEVIATAVDAYDAREKIKKLNPDVITLDIEMPNMDGIAFLRKIMSLRPMPVVMVSSLTQRGANATIEALEIGAVDYVPKLDSKTFDAGKLGAMLIEKVKAAARAKVSSPSRPPMLEKPPALQITGKFRAGALIAIGSSTGGVEAVRDIVTVLPEDAPPVVITQHMPGAFTKTFAKRLDGLAHMRIKEAEEGDRLESGCIYIAPGNLHLRIERTGGSYWCRLGDGEHVSGHKPSVDVLFESVAEAAGKNAVGAILTGMGKDGARGMLQMKKAGAFTIGQDEATCVVYGMPKAAWMAGAVDVQLPLSKIASEALQKCI